MNVQEFEVLVAGLGESLRQYAREAQRQETNGAPSNQPPSFDNVESALLVVPDMAGAFDKDGATFDQLFEARYGRWPAESKHLQKTELENAALAFLYPKIRSNFQEHRGRIQEEYWCRSFPAAAVRTVQDGTGASDFFAIVDWKQEDAKFVEQIFKLDEIEVGTRFLPEGTERRRAGRLIFDAYSCALDALESRRQEQVTDQKAELELVKDRVEKTRKFFESAAKRYAQAESVRGLVATIIVILSLAAVAGTFFWAIGVSPAATPARLLSWAVAGAIGACLSVIVRIARDDYTPNWEASKSELQVAGAIRPLIGAVLGAAIPVLVISGLAALTTQINDSDDVKTRFVYLSLALAAGFSERWAQDLIAKQPSVLGTADTAKNAQSAATT